ncbi:MAG: hypothetical protein K6G33_11990 [Ruminococcus sp.]|uniref:hypothetical protein n=1 Tax=Ruminococcus sp. TaxID=41978 RepID=UPI0025D8761E|nr:hypothetical protein [Ruminococcus sp.]MCR5601447.1 hypothetical protein [Ruminococcus sp.]
MKVVNVLLRLLAADILSMFINMTLAGSSSTAVRAVCAVCTAGILVTVLGDHAVKAAHTDLKGKQGSAGMILAGAFASLPALISWIILYVSANSGGFDYYRWHKLINATFLQYYNLIEPDALSSSLSLNELLMMLPTAAVPAAAVIIPYLRTKRRGTL